MKINFFATIFLFHSLFGEAQISQEEIVKFQIYKISESIFVNDSPFSSSAIFYDKYGNPFKETDGIDEKKIENIYENNLLKKTVQYNFNGEEEETTEYFYKPDGNYMTITSKKIFGAKNYFWYDSKKKIIKAYGGDTIYYRYNKRGKLDRIYSGPNDKEAKVFMKCSYNSKGWLTRVQMQSDNFIGSERHEYDKRGKLIKTIQEEKGFGISNVTVITYYYNEKGLLTKEMAIEQGEGGKSKTTILLYEYEFYVP